MAKQAKVEFTATILKSKHMDNTYIPVDFDVEETFGKKRLKAKIWYDDVLYRGLLAKYNGEYNLMMNKAVREKVGKQAGDKVRIKIEEDLDERKIEIPKLITDFFKKEKDLKPVFDKMSYSHQKEYVLWLTSAKREETLQNRLVKFREMLHEKIKK